MSQHHRILVSGPTVQLLFGVDEIRVQTNSSCNWPGLNIAQHAEYITYFHLPPDHHDILLSEAAPAESLFMGEETLYAMSSEGLQELGQIFEFAWHNLPDGFGDAARPIARNFAAELLRAA